MRLWLAGELCHGFYALPPWPGAGDLSAHRPDQQAGGPSVLLGKLSRWRLCPSAGGSPGQSALSDAAGHFIRPVRSALPVYFRILPPRAGADGGLFCLDLPLCPAPEPQIYPQGEDSRPDLC